MSIDDQARALLKEVMTPKRRARQRIAEPLRDAQQIEIETPAGKIAAWRHGEGPAVLLVHGWQDEIVPFEHSVRFGREHGVTLHLLNADHRMHGQLRTIQQLFERFIVELDLPEPR